MGDMNNSEFKVPAPAEPFTPGAIAEDTPAADFGHKVAGVGMQKPPEPAAPIAVMPNKQIDLTDDEAAPELEPDDLEVKHCPACGFEFDVKGEPQVTDMEKRRWLRHVLGEDRFTRVHELFDGALTVTFRTRTTAENDEVFNQLTLDIRDGTIPEAPAFASPAYIARMCRYLLTVSVESIARIDPEGKMPVKTTNYPEVNGDNYVTKDGEKPIVVAHAEILSPMSEALVASLLNEHKNFEATVGTLIVRSNDPDFWKPAGKHS